MAKHLNKKLVLENGEQFFGSGFGYDSGKSGKVCRLVFNTSMFGYQEIICDPSNEGLMVLMTYPVIGSTGISASEKAVPHIGALVVREYNDLPSNFLSEGTLSELLCKNEIPAIEGVDTRALTALLRDNGSVMAVITDADTSAEEALELIKNHKEENLLEKSGASEKYSCGEEKAPCRIALIDCGCRADLPQSIAAQGCRVECLPWNCTADDVSTLKPHAVVIAGGAGTPAQAGSVVQTAKALVGTVPMLGIGLGADIAAMACGAETTELKAGHRGGNRPMRRLSDGKVNIYNANYDYIPTEDSLAKCGFEVLCRDVIDGTVTAVADREKKVCVVMYNPDLNPAAQDYDRITAGFINAVKEGAENA